MKALNIRHIGILVNDIEKETIWYRNFGFKILQGRPDDIDGTATVKLRFTGNDLVCLELVKRKLPFDGMEEPFAGKHHISFTVDKIPDHFKTHLNPGYGIKAVAFDKDPEGNVIELVELEN